MAEPEEVVQEDENYMAPINNRSSTLEKGGGGSWMGYPTTRDDEDGVGQLDNGEVTQVSHVHAMARHTEQGQRDREVINCG